MKVILKEEVPNLGKPGQIVRVADGFARNFLLPRNLVAAATEDNVRQMAHVKRQIFIRQEKEKREAIKLAEQLKNVSITIPMQAGDEDRIFGSVTTRDIAESLKEEGFKINRRHISLDETIKKLGVYQVSIKLHAEVNAAIKLWVVAK